MTRYLFIFVFISLCQYSAKGQLNLNSVKNLNQHSQINTNEFEWNINAQPNKFSFWGGNRTEKDSIAFFTLKKKDMYWGNTNTKNGGYITGYGNWRLGMFFNGVFTTTSHSLGPIATDFLMYRAGWYASVPHEGNLLYADEEKVGIMSASRKRFYHRVEVDRKNITINSADTLFLNAASTIVLNTVLDTTVANPILLAIHPETHQLQVVSFDKVSNPLPQDFTATKKQRVFKYTNGIGVVYQVYLNGKLVREGINADYTIAGTTVTFNKGVKKGAWVQIDVD